jgi:protein TonB
MSEPVVRVQPTYPTIARMQKVSGIVEVDAYINEKGDVVRAQAVSGPMLLRAAAEEAVMKWKFKPASINSVNIASQARISVSFKMK